MIMPSDRNLAYFSGDLYRLTTLGPGSISRMFMSTRIAEWLLPITPTVSSADTRPVAEWLHLVRAKGVHNLLQQLPVSGKLLQHDIKGVTKRRLASFN